MERVESLIHRLGQQAAARSSAADLLVTTELLYKELVKHANNEPLVNVGTVAVWLPKGFQAAEAREASWPTPQEPVHKIVETQAPPKPSLAEVRMPQRPAAVYHPAPAVKELQPEPAAAAATAPAPSPNDSLPESSPASDVPVINEPAPPAVENLVPAASPAGQGEEGQAIFHLEVEPSPEELAEIALAEKKRLEAEKAEASKLLEQEFLRQQTEEPVLEQKAPQAPPLVTQQAPPPAKTKPFPLFPDVADVIKKVFPTAPAPAPARREVNELVADPAAPVLNEKLSVRGKELGDMLASGNKITDIRKAISINEKYQIINSLFRGDEDMFERSVRTLNNFGSLPEARFWMQRELVVKMGWNDEDELVQHFYRLVSRRFS